jgi:DNA-binding transcriptional ArsR family regulator
MRRGGRSIGACLYALTGICLYWHIETVIETLAALAEPNRFRIVELLRSGPRPVNDIGERLQLNQPQVSKHLRMLKEAGLVDVQPRAQQRLYELRPQPLRQLHGWLERYREIWDARFEELDEVIEELKAKEKLRGRKKRK